MVWVAMEGIPDVLRPKTAMPVRHRPRHLRRRMIVVDASVWIRAAADAGPAETPPVGY
jgi:hypothetical protein